MNLNQPYYASEIVYIRAEHNDLYYTFSFGASLIQLKITT